MPNLDEHFRALTKVRPPAEWPELEAIEPRFLRPLGPSSEAQPRRLRTRSLPRERHRGLAAAVAFAVAAAGIGFAIWAFEGTPEPPKPGPAVTAENGKIAFVAGDFPRYEIFTLNPDGTQLMKLADGRDPAWSPDGSRLAFTIQRPGLGIAVMNADGTGVTELVDDPAYAQSPSWSPDATRIAFAAQNGIYVMNADGTDVRRVDGYSGPLACGDHEPSWSPDGATIAWAVRCDGGGLGIWTVRPDGSRRSILVDEGSGLWTFNYPSWSPDGSLLAFEGGRPVFGDAPGPVAEMGVYLVDADGSRLTKLADGTEPAWSPDGTMIAFVRDRDLFVVDKDGGQVTQVTSDRFVSLGPSWQPVPVEDEVPTPEPTTTPEGTITLPADAIPEGTLVVHTNAGAEVIRAGSERSGSVPGVRFPLDFSPDGSTVLGRTGRDRSGDLIVVDLLTGESRILVRPAGDDLLGAFAQWSPDGLMVAYTIGTGDPADRSTLCVLALASEEPSCFPEVERVYTFNWAPDGGRLVVAGPPVQPVRIVDVATGEVSEVVAQEGVTPINAAIRDAGMGTSFQLVGPTWSPSGTYLAALANLEDSEFAYVPVVFTPDGRFVAFGRASGDYPEPFEWSPVADVLAYTRREAANRGHTEAHLLDPVSGDDRVLVSGEGTQPFFVLTDMAWAPSGRWLAIAGWEDFGEGRFQTSIRVLHVADPASFEQFSIETAEADNFIGDWGP